LGYSALCAKKCKINLKNSILTAPWLFLNGADTRINIQKGYELYFLKRNNSQLSHWFLYFFIYFPLDLAETVDIIPIWSF